MRILTGFFLLALAACAAGNRQVQLAERGDKDHPHYIGHSENGEVILSADHYRAMNGLAVAASDLGAKGDEQLICKREMPTGTHVPKWICRYPKGNDLLRIQTRDALIQPRGCSDCRGN